MLTAIALSVWYAAIAAKAATIPLLIWRVRMPLLMFSAYIVAGVARSLYLVTLRHDLEMYKAVLSITEPFMRMAAAAVFVEAFLWLSYRLVARFRPLLIGAFALTCLLAAGIWAASEVVWDWKLVTVVDYLAALERSAGLALGGALAVLVLAGEPWALVDRRALHHAAALCLSNVGIAAAYIVAIETRAAYEPLSSLISCGSAIVAYGLVWCRLVGGADYQPHMPSVSHPR